MFGFVNCNASVLAKQTTDPQLFFVRILVKNWLWPIITCFGVTGNILTIVVLTKRRMIMSSTNNYLVALALVDIAYLILTLILNTAQHPCFSHSSLSQILLTICRPIADFSSNSSVWITVTFTVERWVAITYPLKSRTWCTVNRARKIIIGVMCAALISASPSAFEMKLVRIVERQNSTNSNDKPMFKTRFRAEPTALANNPLYHRIYFNFVTFAIIWIPLVLLAIFNMILIRYVRHSKHNEHRISDGMKLRRHNRGNQGEQRKTTIMLIAVVIVFTVCQIPQAISLTVQSFFPVLSQTPKVLIYNNFANCLVAINASMNFILYCCFSERFRSTFGSSFVFLGRCCSYIMGPNWKISSDNNKYSISLDNMSINSVYTQSSFPNRVTSLNTRISNMSTDLSQKYLRKTLNNRSSMLNPEQRTWSHLFGRLRSKKPQLRQTFIWQSTETAPNSPTLSLLKSPPYDIQQSRLSNNSGYQSIIEEETERPRSSTVSFSPDNHFPKHQSSSVCTLDRSIYQNYSTECFQKFCSVDSSKLNQCSTTTMTTTIHPSNCSQRSFDESNEPIWIKRRLPNNTIEKLIDRRKTFLWKEIIDATV